MNLLWVLRFPQICKTCRLGELKTNFVKYTVCPACTLPLTEYALRLALAPAKQMKESGSTCCLCNKSLEVLQTSQEPHAEEGRARDFCMGIGTDLIERKWEKKRNFCERCPGNTAQDVVN